MSLKAWRLVKTKYLAHAFDGEGARIFGGRWNSPGVPVVYLAQSLALAALEVLVHLQSAQPLTAWSSIPVTFSERLVKTVPAGSLPARWNEWPAPVALQEIGDAWVAGGASAMLSVPSAVVPAERIYLLNPLHPGFRRVRIGEATPFAFDARLKPGRATG